MSAILRASMLALIALVLAGCGGGGSSVGDGGPPQPAAQVLRDSIASTHAAHTYPYYVRVPADYATSTKAYPVIYSMDAENRFAGLSQVLQQRSTQAILVAVDATGLGRRWGDFTWPGAEAYFRFLTRELIPRIDSQYRTDPRQRMLTGHSLSGEFVVFAMLLDPPDHRFFSSIFASDPSLWATTPAESFAPTLPIATALEQRIHDAGRPWPISIVLAGDFKDREGNGTRARSYYDFLVSRSYEQLRIRHVGYTLGHLAMDVPAFHDALDFVDPRPAP